MRIQRVLLVLTLAIYTEYSTRVSYVSKKLIMYLTPITCHTHVNCRRFMCFYHTDIFISMSIFIPF